MCGWAGPQLTNRCTRPPKLGSNSVGCCLQNWLKTEMISLAKLGYHRAGICTPTKIFPDRAIERRVNSSVIRLAVFDNRKNQTVPFLEETVSVQPGGVKRRSITVQRGRCSGQVVYGERHPDRVDRSPDQPGQMGL